MSMRKVNKKGFAYQLKEQAGWLTNKERSKPKQVSLKRAISTAYYALFRLLIDEGCRLVFVKTPAQNHIFYNATRSIKHDRIKSVAKELTKNRISNKLHPFLGTTNTSSELENICRAIIDLQEARHDADYNVRYKITNINLSFVFR